MCLDGRRWLAISGYAVAVALPIGSYYRDWTLMVFPLWVLKVSLCTLAVREAGPGPAMSPDLGDSAEDAEVGNQPQP